MSVFPKTTKNRLQKIPQSSSVWEGDRRNLGEMASDLDRSEAIKDDCIMWVDGSEGEVRAMEIVSVSMGPEAIVRTLLKAMESPHYPGSSPARPKKIVVRDRQIQFFLRGALQGLDIEIEYNSDLPIIERLFQSLQARKVEKPESLPPQYLNLLSKKAEKVWITSPWEFLADSDILAIEISDCATDTLYACVMGMMSSEYGVLLYRSQDSLKKFRSVITREESQEELEKAFFAQDCWFLNYEEDDDDDFDSDELVEITPLFGSIHPLEGIRPFLDEQEAEIIYLALEGILKFCSKYQNRLNVEDIPSIEADYYIKIPKVLPNSRTVKVKVATQPDLTKELWEMIGDSVESEEINIPIQEDLVPDGALVSLSTISPDLIKQLQQQGATFHQDLNLSNQKKDLPSVFIQTSRPKAKTLIDNINQSGGLKAICFNPGEDPFSDTNYELGMLQTADGKLHIFGEYSHNSNKHSLAMKNWRDNCKISKGYCTLIVSMGVTGASRGNPQPKDMLGVFEARAISGDELGMGILQLMPSLD